MVTRRAAIAGAMGCLAAPGMVASQDAFESTSIHRGRATVPVSINGTGGLRFAVDTAANCSVIAEDMVDRLGLAPAGELGMHTLVGREVVSAVLAGALDSGALNARDVRLAIGRRSAIAGLDGLLGCDLLLDRRLILNFRSGERVRIARSRAQSRGFLDPVDPHTRLVAAGQRRFQSLLMIRARVGSTSAVAIVDSGAEGTILNLAAARAGRAVPIRLDDGSSRARIQSPTGQTTSGEAMMLRSLGFAGVSISNLPVVAGDFHTFQLWGLANQPAMLIGLDVLRLFDTVFIDLKRSEFSLRV